MLFPSSAYAVECGKSSFYTLYGNRTASGSIMAPGFTTAHRTLPFGTILRVTNPKNNKTAEVVVNDRGPVPKSRILDVNRTVAEHLGFINKGVTQLCMEIVQK